MSPLWQQAKLRDFCHKKGIHITAFSPLGARGTVWGTNQVLDCEVLKEIAEAQGKTVAEVTFFLYSHQFFFSLSSVLFMNFIQRCSQVATRLIESKYKGPLCIRIGLDWVITD